MNGEDNKEKEKKAGNPLFILIIFICLLGFLFFVPDIYKKFNSGMAEILGVGSKDDDKVNEKPDDGKDAISDQYQIGSKSTVQFNEITLSNMDLNEENILTFTIEADKTINLDDLNYYLEFYRNRKTFIGRRVLTGEVKKSKTFMIDVSNLDIDTTVYFTISHIGDDAIKSTDAPSDESGLASLVCTKNEESYEYEFSLNKLSKVVKKMTFTNLNIDEYAKALLEYEKKENEYNELRGVTSKIVETENNSFIFMIEFDYSEVAVFNTFKDNNLFKKDNMYGIVKFKMDSRGYDCK